MASGNAAFSDDTQLISKVPSPLPPLFHTSKVEGRACNGDLPKIEAKKFLDIQRKCVENKCY